MERSCVFLALLFFLFASVSQGVVSARQADACVSFYGASANTPSEFEELSLGYGLRNNCGETVVVQNVRISFHQDQVPHNFIQICFQPNSDINHTLTDGETQLFLKRTCNFPKSNINFGNFKLRYGIKLDGTWFDGQYERNIELLPALEAAPEQDIISLIPAIISSIKDTTELSASTEFYPPFGNGDWRLTRSYTYQSHICYGDFYSPASSNGNPACDTYALDFAPEQNVQAADKLEVRAVADGDIIVAKDQGNFGKTVLIKHGGNLISRYAHLQQISVQSGRVKKGQKLGLAGNTGNSFGRHLHFAMYKLKLSTSGKASVEAFKPEPLGGISGFPVQTKSISAQAKFRNIGNKLICIENCESIFPIVSYQGLMWDVNDTRNMNWYASEAYCSDRKKFNYADWRLPTKIELKNVVRCSNGKPTPLADGEGCAGFGYDITYDIPAVVSRLGLSVLQPYWSGTRAASNAFYGVDYSDGRVSLYTSSNNFSAMCVRDN